LTLLQRYLMEAARFKRAADTCTDKQVAERLILLAADYLEEAEGLRSQALSAAARNSSQ